MRKLLVVLVVMVSVASTSLVFADQMKIERHFVKFAVGEHTVPEQDIFSKLSNLQLNSFVRVYGYTDDTGSAKRNREIADLRASFLVRVIKKQVPNIMIAEVKGLPSHKTSINATTGEIRIFTPVMSDPEIISSFKVANKKIDTVAEKIDAFEKSAREGLINLRSSTSDEFGQVKDGLKEISKTLEGSFFEKNKQFIYYCGIAIGAFIMFIFFLSFVIHKKRKKELSTIVSTAVMDTNIALAKKEIERPWPKDMQLIAEMYFGKKNGDQIRTCGYCGCKSKGKKYIAHLRKCKESPLFGLTADEAKNEMNENMN